MPNLLSSYELKKDDLYVMDKVKYIELLISVNFVDAPLHFCVVCES